MNKRLVLAILLFIVMKSFSQQPFHIMGNLQIHDQGSLGFHTDLINNGIFDQNLGSVGFYNTDRSLTISGNNKPVFYDILTAVTNDLILKVNVGVINFKEFLFGRIITPRTDSTITLDLQNDAPYNGITDGSHTDGYVTYTGNLSFTFPIGDDFRLRPMRTSVGASAMTSSGAYFFEDPNTPTTFQESFDTNKFQSTLAVINPLEFWDLNGAIPTQVTLTWDPQSRIANIADKLSYLRVVGWSSTEQKWINLGNTGIKGNQLSGEITSNLILPNDYSVLTIGSILGTNETVTVYNAISPNNDGLNDTLIIRGIEAIPDNELVIFNRWGQEVYRKKGYDNSWSGNSEGRVTPKSTKELPVGTYYYVLQVHGKKSTVGYFYLQR